MRRFIYYFPGVSGMNDTMLRDRGAWDRFGGIGDKANAGYQIMAVRDGPAGGGVIVAPGQNEPAFRPGDQQWIEGPKFWVGIEDLAPCPEDLVRVEGIEGYDVTLGDGCVWRVPRVLRWDPHRLSAVSNLPRVKTITTVNGKFQIDFKVRPQYQAADAMARGIFEAFAEERVMTEADRFRAAAGILAINYRIGIEEASLLGLIDMEADTEMRILHLAIDYPAYQAQAAEFAVMGVQYSEPRIED